MSRILPVALALILAACSGSPAPEEPQSTQVYEVRGTLAQLPAGPGTELMVRHEAIPDFVDAAGDTVGMREMTMGFPLADGVELEGFAPGDSVVIEFRVRWGQPRPLELSRIEHR